MRGDHGNVKLQRSHIPLALVCEIVVRELPGPKKKCPEGAPEFSIDVDEMTQQLVTEFCDSWGLALRILAAVRTIGTAGWRPAVATRCAAR